MQIVKILQILSFALLLSLSVSAQRTNITVNTGSGDGAYRGQGFAHVWADPNPPGMVFDRWTGDTVWLQNPLEYHTKIRTAKLNVNLTATYKPAPVWNPTFETINGSAIGWYFPVSPVGVIFHFHGTGGSATGLFSNAEQRVFANEAVAAGYAVISLSSVDRVNRQWNPNPLIENNPDMQNVQAAINLFVSRGLMTAATPIFATGISNGGAFAPRVSRALSFRGTAIFIAAGTSNILSQTTVPTIWLLMSKDTTIGSDGNAQAFSNYQNLIGRGVPAQYNVLAPSPVYPERFWRITNLTADDSRVIYNALKQNGFLDGRDYLVQNPTISNWQSVIPAQYTSYSTEIANQLEICYTEHNFYSDYDRRVLDFFNSRL